MSPYKCLLKLRIIAASNLLIKGEPIAQVAYDVGFFDQSHMTKHFKKEYGVTPHKFCVSYGESSESFPSGGLDD
jgi:AraC-like DNA-binding protein